MRRIDRGSVIDQYQRQGKVIIDLLIYYLWLDRRDEREEDVCQQLEIIVRACLHCYVYTFFSSRVIKYYYCAQISHSLSPSSILVQNREGGSCSNGEQVKMGRDKFEFAIDRGGTFTDVYARCPGGKIRVMKLLSVDPANYEDAPREGIRRILEQVFIFIEIVGSIDDNVRNLQETGRKMEGEIDGSLISWIRMGTTVATNALLERKGARMALLINEGFKDLLFIGNQARPDIFDLVSNIILIIIINTLQ